jgi:hypothetical protein
MLAFLFVTILIIPAIWLWLFIKDHKEDLRLNDANKTRNMIEL